MPRPNAADAACRLLILAFVAGKAQSLPPLDVWRAAYAGWSKEEQARTVQEIDGQSRRLCDALKRSGIWEFMTADEQAMAEASVLQLTEAERLKFAGAVEAAACLMWALGLIPAPIPMNEAVDPEVLGRVPSSNLRGFIDSAMLRPEAEIEAARGRAELWHWRSRTRELEKAGSPFPADEQLRRSGLRSFDDVVRATARLSHENRMLDAVIDDDFPARGQAYRDLSDEEGAQLASIALERHRAFNWLCGLAPDGDWDLTPTDT